MSMIGRMDELFFQNLQTNPTLFFSVVITVILSITLHELAHGWAAVRLGDRTPIETGHMTLNPVVHMGVISIILLLTLGIAFGAMLVDPTRLRGRYANAWVALAGPAMNLFLGLIGLVGLGLWLRFGTLDPTDHVQLNAFVLLSVFGPTNIALMLFNLLPVPPLDGSRVVADFVPAYRRLISGEAVRGLMTAVFFAMFLGGASYIFRAAYAASDGVIYAIAGRERVRVVRPDPVSEDAATDTAPDSMPSPTQPAAERL